MPPRELRNAERVLSVALRRDWTNTPSYWFELWEQVKGKIHFWIIRRKWNFYKGKGKNRELIEGYSISTRFTGLTTVLDAVQEGIHEKIAEKGFLVCEVFSVAKLNEFADGIDVNVAGKKTKTMPKEDNKTQFADAMKRRKRKGFWS